jgi:hypothetical protein
MVLCWVGCAGCTSGEPIIHQGTSRREGLNFQRRSTTSAVKFVFGAEIFEGMLPSANTPTSPRQSILVEHANRVRFLRKSRCHTYAGGRDDYEEDLLPTSARRRILNIPARPGPGEEAAAPPAARKKAAKPVGQSVLAGRRAHVTEQSILAL